MFFFGDPQDTADLYSRNAFEVTGPALPEYHYEEMSEEELRIALTYARIAYKDAEKDGASQEVLDLLLAQHDSVFEFLASISEKFRTQVKGNACLPLGGHASENVLKYKRLAGVAS